MKKNKKLLIVVLFSLAFLSACDSQMDIMPDTKIAESPELFNNESSLTSLTNGLYQNIDYSAILNDNTSDNMAYINTPPAIRWGQYTQPTALGSGGWSWSELRQINYIILYRVR